MKRIAFFILLLIFSSCAKIPVQTIKLTDAVIEEGQRMHQLNLLLIEKMFADKRERIDLFIEGEYIPKYLANFQKNIPEETNYKEEFTGMMNSIIPHIIKQRNLMHTALETQRVKLISKINADYLVYEQATAQLKALIESAVKVNDERTLAFEQLADITNNSIDLNKLDQILDDYIGKAGEIGENLDVHSRSLDQAINSLLNK